MEALFKMTTAPGRDPRPSSICPKSAVCIICSSHPQCHGDDNLRGSDEHGKSAGRNGGLQWPPSETSSLAEGDAGDCMDSPEYSRDGRPGMVMDAPSNLNGCSCLEPCKPRKFAPVPSVLAASEKPRAGSKEGAYGCRGTRGGCPSILSMDHSRRQQGCTPLDAPAHTIWVMSLDARS